MALTIRMWIRDHREVSDWGAAHRLGMPDTTSVGPATLPGCPLETRRSLSVWPCTAPAVGLGRPRPAARPIPSNGTSRGVTSGQLFPRLGGKFGYLKTLALITHTWLLSDAGFRMAPRWPEQDRSWFCS